MSASNREIQYRLEQVKKSLSESPDQVYTEKLAKLEETVNRLSEVVQQLQEKDGVRGEQILTLEALMDSSLGLKSSTDAE